MTVSNIQLFKILNEKLGENQAETLVNFVEEKVQSEFEERKEIFAIKEDIAKLEGKFDTRVTELSVLIINGQKANILWTITTLVLLFGVAITILKFIK